MSNPNQDKAILLHTAPAENVGLKWTQNLPNLRLLCLTYDGLLWSANNTDVAKVRQEIAVEKGITIEIINL